jgi:hypothetical protein
VKTFTVEVTQIITVTLDESKFDDTFMEEFRESFYQFDTLEEHAEHLAQLEARGLVNDYKPFIEGYGPAEEMGIKLKAGPAHTEVVGTPA